MDNPEDRPLWFGSEVRLAADGKRAVVIQASKPDENGVQRVTIAREDGTTCEEDSRFMQLIRPSAAYLTEGEWLERQERWHDVITDQRKLGRIEGQQQAHEMYLLRATGLNLSYERIKQMLSADVIQGDWVVDEARKLYGGAS